MMMRSSLPPRAFSECYNHRAQPQRRREAACDTAGPNDPRVTAAHETHSTPRAAIATNRSSQPAPSTQPPVRQPSASGPMHQAAAAAASPPSAAAAATAQLPTANAQPLSSSCG